MTDADCMADLFHELAVLIMEEHAETLEQEDQTND